MHIHIQHTQHSFPWNFHKRTLLVRQNLKMQRLLKNPTDPVSPKYWNKRDFGSIPKPRLSNETNLKSDAKPFHQRPLTVSNADVTHQLVNRPQKLLPLRRNVGETVNPRQRTSNSAAQRNSTKSQQIKRHMEVFFRKKERAKIYSRWSPTSIKSMPEIQSDRSTIMKKPYSKSTLSPSHNAAGDGVRMVRPTNRIRHSSFHLIPEEVQMSQTSHSSHSFRRKLAIDKLINTAIVQSCRLQAEKDFPPTPSNGNAQESCTDNRNISTPSLDFRLNANAPKPNPKMSKSRIDNRWSFDATSVHSNGRQAKTPNNQQADQQTAVVG